MTEKALTLALTATLSVLSPAVAAPLPTAWDGRALELNERGIVLDTGYACTERSDIADMVTLFFSGDKAVLNSWMIDRLKAKDCTVMKRGTVVIVDDAVDGDLIYCIRPSKQETCAWTFGRAVAPFTELVAKKSARR